MKFLTFATLLSLTGTANASPTPKMLAEPAYSGKPLGPVKVEESVSSRSATLLGDCTPSVPFIFTLHGPSGVAAIGVDKDATPSIALSTGEAHLGAETQHFFAFPDDDIVGYPLEYMVADSTVKDGVTATLTCSADTPVIVIVKDSIEFEVHAKVTETTGGALLEVAETANGKLQGFTRAKRGSERSPVSFSDASDNKIKVNHQSGNSERGTALVDGLYTSAEGYKVRRTIIQESRERPNPKPRTVPVQCCDITEDGDVQIGFPGMLQPGESLRVDIRVGLALEGASVPVGVVDVTAFLAQGNVMTVHGGWLRNALSAEGLQDTTEEWDVVVIDAVVSDENNVVGVMHQANQNGLANSAGRGKLSQAPSSNEVAISDDMKVGKKPTPEQRRRQLNTSGRRLSGGLHKKILVHGYCSGSNPFPTSHFTNYVVFSDHNANRSHNQFALLIDSFADNQGLHGCGIVAHSQGGAASLHLYTYYWSCLDYPSTSGRMIQSVGTPYQGTALAGNLAALGDIFGAGCGKNDDLTYSGAAAWLSGIPSWARSQVTYYTTSFNDRWWAWDYCHLASDTMLNDPDDGTTEKDEGQLSGGNNGGHKTGWCHISGMRDPGQTTDSSRNSVMNSNAQY